MGYDFKGKRAVVTGAGKGIGRGTVKGLVECGAEVIAVSRTQADLDSLQKEVKGIIPMCLDVSDVETVQKTLSSVGKVDMLVNNAGVTSLQSFLDVTPDEYDKVMATNHRAVLFVSQTIARDMVKRGEGGVIVNVSSIASQVAFKDHACYCSSKGAVDMLTKVMGLELGQHKIRVNSVNPTVVLTDMGKLAWSDPEKAGPVVQRIPTGRFAEIEDVVNVVLFLLSDKSAMVNCETLLVDGGFHAC